jgi:hypothetical protein
MKRVKASERHMGFMFMIGSLDSTRAATDSVRRSRAVETTTVVARQRSMHDACPFAANDVSCHVRGCMQRRVTAADAMHARQRPVEADTRGVDAGAGIASMYRVARRVVQWSELRCAPRLPKAEDAPGAAGAIRMVNHRRIRLSVPM